jgi:N-acetylmuramic acid 6-phosphate etherase
LDASEIPPTFSAPHEWFQGIIAGGEEALVRSIEGAEDSSEDAIQDLKKCHFSKHDLLVGISCSGSAKYVVSALDYARSLGAFTAYLVTNKAPYRATKTDVLMAVNIGPEVVTGSTRMKAGTATKLILNMISTATMIRMGKTLGNLMVDLQVVNEKLLDRGRRIISEITGFEAKKSEKLLRESGMSVKTAIVMGLMQCSAKDAIAKLEKNEGFLRRVLSE